VLDTRTGELGGVFEVVAHGKVAIISWKNVKNRNAFDKKMAGDLRSIIEEIGAGSEFHTILLDPGQGVFCSGWDLDEIRAVREGSTEECGLLIDQGRECLDSLINSSCYVIAIAQGHVLGFGISMLCNSDNVIISDDSKLALPELAVGVVPASVVGDLVSKVGSSRAMQWALSGKIDHLAAMHSGLVHSIVPQERIEQIRVQLTDHLNTLSVNQVRATVSIIRSMKNLGLGEAKKFGDEGAKVILKTKE